MSVDWLFSIFLVYLIDKKDNIACDVNPLSTTGLLTCFLIGSYQDIFIC